MRALAWQRAGRVAVEEVPEPQIIEPSDAIIRVTSAAVCGSDLHLLDVLAPFLHRGDVLGHETMGVVERPGSGTPGARRAPRGRDVRPGDTALAAVRQRTHGRGPDSVIDAVGMEAHGNPVAAFAQAAAGSLPNPADPLGTEDLVTHRGSLDDAPELYDAFRDKDDGCVKVVLSP